MKETLLMHRFKKGKIYVITSKPKVGKTSFGFYLFDGLCKMNVLENNSYAMLQYAVGFDTNNILADIEWLQKAKTLVLIDVKTKYTDKPPTAKELLELNVLIQQVKSSSTTEQAGIIFLMPYPLVDDFYSTNMEIIEEEIQEKLLSISYGAADEILFLNRPHNKPENIDFKISRVHIINPLQQRRIKAINYKVDFNTYVFEEREG